MPSTAWRNRACSRGGSHPSDGRTTLATITPRGRSLAEKATDAVNRDVFTHPGLEPDAVNALVEVVRTLRHQAGDWEEPEAP